MTDKNKISEKSLLYRETIEFWVFNIKKEKPGRPEGAAIFNRLFRRKSESFLSAIRAR